MTELWVKVIAITGVAGLGAWALSALYKQLLGLPYFRQMNSKQTHSILRLVLVLVWLFAIACLVVYVVVTTGNKDHVADVPSSYEVGLASNGQILLHDFELTYLVSGREVSTESSNGLAKITVPASLQTLSGVRVVLPCYQQLSSGPFGLVEGKVIQIPVERVLSPPPDPLPPTAYPDPKTVIPASSWPLQDSMSPREPELVRDQFVFRYNNNSGVLVHILLFNFEQHARDKDPWRVFHSDPCAGPAAFSGFEEANGMFAVIALPSDSKTSEFIGIADVYAKKVTNLQLTSAVKGIKGSLDQHD